MKLQMKFQKILLLVSLILSAVCIVYSFAYFTGALANLNNYYGEVGGEFDINCDALYERAQGFNDILLVLSIIYLCIIVVMYILQCSSRRNYYITNYISSIVAAVYCIVFAVICLAMNASIMAGFFSEIDWEAYHHCRELADPAHPYNDSIVMFVLGFVIHILVIADGVFIGLNLLWKRKLMKGEQELLEKGATESTQPTEQEVA